MTVGAVLLPLRAVERAPITRFLPAWMVALIALAYAMPGLIGHDPWKQDEAYVFGAVYEMLQTGDWVIPRVAGVPFMEKPPLFHWIAAATATAFSRWLPLHDGARLASLVFVLATLGAVAASSRLLWGKGRETTGTLLVLSPLGLLMNAQLMLPDLPLMAGFAFAALGLAGCARERRWGGAVLGIGSGIGFLGKGLIAPCVIALAAVSLPIAFAQWRNHHYFRQLRIAFAFAAPFLTIWPAALWLRSPELFDEWFWANNVGRFVGFSAAALGAETEPGFYAQAFPWFLFPLWVFVAVGAWRERRRFLDHAAVQIGLVLCLAIASVLVTAASARVVYALPMIGPLALAAVGAIERTPAWCDRALAAFGMAVAVVACAVVWPAWSSLAFTARAPAWLGRWFPEHFALPDSAVSIAAALALTLGFALVAWRSQHSAQRGLAVWVAALALAWGLPATLWLPWIDHAKSYRAVFQSMAPSIPEGYRCVAGLSLGESERAMLHYVLGIKALDHSASCDALVRRRTVDDATSDLPPIWRLVWSGHRPGERRESFELYVRR